MGEKGKMWQTLMISNSHNSNNNSKNLIKNQQKERKFANIILLVRKVYAIM